MSSGSRTLFLPSLLVVGALALAGCSSGTSSGSGPAPASDRSVFEFGSTPDSASGGEVTAQLPDGLVEARKIDGVTVPVRSVTLRSQEVTSTSLCAVEFNEGGEAIATAPTRTADDIDGKKDPGIAVLNLKTGDLVLGMVSDLERSGELPKGAFEEAQKVPYGCYKANL